MAQYISDINDDQGPTIVPFVPEGDRLTVSNAVMWLKEKIPVEDHFSFIATIGSENDPAPNLVDFLRATKKNRISSSQEPTDSVVICFCIE